MISGSLSTSVFEPDLFLVGASGGVYALLTSQLANIVLVSQHIIIFTSNNGNQNLTFEFMFIKYTLR
jgi:hypothetical protein